eukprot:TRINITY_DN12063_c0_g1_i1.p1 TRINITY_DN12063_c0_g1~~TRINITY_DN12063_c0_g1_i1.p1  ORF type:complete len:1207 (+),score=282.20 TRINITY_DN12063_c0_g1_i1:89-3709(+)
MHIKRVIIKGFKSYASQLDFDTFDSGSNVIVGKNGAGKSNFIEAIRFVLASDSYQRKLSSEEKKTLLHTGAGGSTLLGYVEIEFDNSDKRLPLDTAEVVLRRSIGLKKDEYTLNGRRAEISDVLSLLESAGFSRSNPYYIVMQGQVAQLTKMTPAERLDLLKEVAGTRVYSERREESVKIMTETLAKKEKIDEVMDMLADRLKELESEKEELSEYRNLDRERRAFEYSIYNHQLQDCVGKLQSVDEERAEQSAVVGQKYAELDQVRNELRAAQSDLLTIADTLSSIDGQRDALLEERKVLLQQQAKATLDLQDKESAMKLTSTSKSGVTKQLREISAQVKSSHTKLAKLAKDFEAVSASEQKLAQEIGSVEGRLKDLLSRAGRQGQFKSAKERDAWIKKEISDIKMQIQRKEQQAQNLQERIRELENRREEDRQLIATRSKGLEERRKALEDASADFEEKKSKRDEFNSKRKELWREESEIDVLIQKHTEHLRKAERRLQSTMSKELAAGLATIDRLRSEGTAEGVYGPIIDLFDCDDKFMTSVEVAAGNSLFHVVVDSDRTATRLVNTLNDEKGGRVTFIPLNRLEVKDVSVTRTEQVKPLVEVLRFKSTFEKAFMQIFGKTLLCGSMEVAANVARLNKMSCITLDGDQVSSRGAMSGGYYDPTSSRLLAHKEVKKFKDMISTAKQQREELRTRISQLDQRIDSAVAEVASADAQRIKSREDLDHFDLSCRNAAKQQLSSEEGVIQANRSLTEVRVSVQALKDTQASLEQEMTMPLTEMSDDERNELQDLSKKLPKLRQQLFEIGQKRISLEGEKTEVENALSSHLLPKQDQLESALASGQLPDVDDAAHVRAELEKIDEKLQTLNQKIDALSEKKEESRTQESELRSAVEALAAQEDALSSEVDVQSRIMDKLMNKRHNLTQKREEATKRLREVGSLPADLTAKFSGKSSAECLLLLHSTNQKLKGYSHVNKKAFDQYTSFTDQREALVQRKQELDESEAAIANLVDTLDHHKDEAIERTVKGVSKYFSEIFSELTNGGKASLIKLVSEGKQKEVKGIEINVSFAAGRVQKMSQLSGGQASIVALSLIFAIQRCDPAPFYVFDEIDPALDDSHRRAVALMIQKASEPKIIQRVESGQVISEETQTQFIMTTHRPELVEIADKHYLIAFSNRNSSINVVNHDEAMSVIGLESVEESAQADSADAE